MATKLGNAEIEYVKPIDPNNPDRVEFRAGKGVCEGSRDYLESHTQGKTFSFSNLPFETTADRRRRGEAV